MESYLSMTVVLVVSYGLFLLFSYWMATLGPTPDLPGFEFFKAATSTVMLIMALIMRLSISILLWVISPILAGLSLIWAIGFFLPRLKQSGETLVHAYTSWRRQAHSVIVGLDTGTKPVFEDDTFSPWGKHPK